LESMSREGSYPQQARPPFLVAAQPTFLRNSARNDAKHVWQGSDERIKLAVMTALPWDLAVPRDRVLVNVSRGWVILIGEVTREYEKARAEADARMTSGVAGVINRLTCEAGN
jgi:osmotically-inducible protein OsmY